MKYAHHRSNLSSPRRSGGKKKRWLIILVALALIVVLFFALRKNEPEPDPVPKPEELIETPEEVEEIPEENPVSFEEINLEYIDGGVAGFARRGSESDEFVHVMVVDLFELNLETHFYEAWLVKPGVTEFFSTGELFAREDGKFGLIYRTPLAEREDIYDFSRVIITREIRDGDEAPSPNHVVEGEF